jgi:hypothetical protein
MQRDQAMKRPAEYEVFIKSARWRNICSTMIKRAKSKCERCGNSSARLEVHHLNYERFGGRERPSDLLVVCKTCHDKLEIVRQQEIKKKAQKALQNARFRGYIIKVHGEEYWLTEVPTDDDYEAFEAFLERKEEEEVRTLNEQLS